MSGARAGRPQLILKKFLTPCLLLVLMMSATAAEPGVRRTPLTVPSDGQSGFTSLPGSVTGIHFTNHLADRSVAENQIRLLGSGVALGDVDGDGRCDIFLARLEGGCALYRNLGGWKFADITARAGVACTNQYSTGAALADLDGDGDLDLLVNSIGGGTRSFFNDGAAKFTERNSGLLKKFCATSLALADLDGNGTLDLYVANYRTTTIRSSGLQVLNINGRRSLRPEDRDGYEITPEGLILEHAEPDAIYLNDGKGNFTPLPWSRFTDADGKTLTRGDRDWGLSVMLRDMNGDGAPDIYVCNDFWSADAIWINDGRGNFRAPPKLALRTTSTFSMGVDFADLNRDGLDDFIVLDMRSRDHARRLTQRAMLTGTPALTRLDERLQTERNTLFLNRGDGTYAEIAQFAGLHASEWSWCPVFLDVDLDGYEDLLVTTGHGFDSQDADTEELLARAARTASEKVGDRILRFPRLNIPNQAFRNRGDLTFEPAGDRWGFNESGVSHGLALADLDGDGDLDAVVNNLNGAVSLYRNGSGVPRVTVRLKGRAPNTAGTGAKIKLTGGPVAQSQEMISGGRYLSGDDALRVFAAWSPTNRFTLEVIWRSGARSVVTNVLANSLIEVDERASVQSSKFKVQSSKFSPLFSDASRLLNHIHRDEPFDDFARQPLLARRLSHGGPGVAWADVDGDGRDDLLIGSGAGGELALRKNLGGKFERLVSPLPTAFEDHTAVLVANRELFVGLSNYEAPTSTNTVALTISLAKGGPMKVLPPSAFGTGPMALADIDGDGDLDWFVGGQAVAGRYPEPATSRLFRNDAGAFTLAQEFKDSGQVNGAVFTDLDEDGFPELVLACEWSPLKLFRNQRGHFTPWNPPVTGPAFNLQPSTFNSLSGFWQGITAADFDGDGRMDFVASNWGRNSPYQSAVREGARIFYGDFSGAGRVDGIEAYVDQGRVVPAPGLETLARALPWLRQRFPTHHAFAAATMAEVLGDHSPLAKELRVSWTDLTVFLNRGDHFETRALPVEAQFAPAFGIVAADFDGDGRADLFLAQNFFETDGETSRYDAGRGLLLRGDGRGDFTPLSGEESGLKIYGAQRGAAAADYDGDGRLDLAVGQNRAETKLFHNETARPGLRVRLRGGAGNLSAIGAVLRRGAGAAQEIHGGSGYWSQDSATAVLGGDTAQITVRWPGGKTNVVSVPSQVRAITIESDGTVRVEK